MTFPETFEVIVIGGGHAGTEAALASARLGAKTLLLTHNIETVGQMSCNPAIGGIGKGHLVKEIDALGGVMARAADFAGIHFRILNASKGAAVRATRAQADRSLYKQYIREAVENQKDLFLFQQAVEDLVIRNGQICGVLTQMGITFHARSVVLTAGTFLDGKIHVGLSHYQGGRAGCPASLPLAKRLQEMPFARGRLKTGTPPRIDGRTIDFSRLQEQPTDLPLPVFSFLGSVDDHPRQVPCYITHTNERTHEIVRQHFDRSPMSSGKIIGRGPRYCPSIEDKVKRFAEKTSHQIFLEPEGLHTQEFYPNGISTSLPFDAQLALVRSIQGLEKAHLTRAGYAIEYDFFDPRELSPSLETRYVKGLFFAGQINGTTGYEEAAAQGMVAGINAARFSQGLSLWTVSRKEAYIGVLIEDLITQGAPEPYRMFTSRAEYRLWLREDNADLRLTPLGQAIGLVSQTQWHCFEKKRHWIEALQTILQTIRFSSREWQGKAIEEGSKEKVLCALDWLRRPEISIKDLLALSSVREKLSPLLEESKTSLEETLFEQALLEVEIQRKYAGYIEKQHTAIGHSGKHEHMPIPENFEYVGLPGLSAEIVEKWTRCRPKTVGLAAQIPGVTPAALSLLLVYLKKFLSEKEKHE